MIHEIEAWDNPNRVLPDPDEPAPILRTTVPDSTPYETFEQRLERDSKSIDMKGVAA